MHGMGHAWQAVCMVGVCVQETQPLKRAVGILLEYILVKKISHSDLEFQSKIQLLSTWLRQQRDPILKKNEPQVDISNVYW